MRKSNHAEKRIRERVGINKKSTDKLISDLEEKGIPLDRLKGNLHKWVVMTIRGGGRGYNHKDKPLIFRNHLYVVRCGVVITVIQIPQNLNKKLKGYIKEDI